MDPLLIVPVNGLQRRLNWPRIYVTELTPDHYSMKHFMQIAMPQGSVQMNDGIPLLKQQPILLTHDEKESVDFMINGMEQVNIQEKPIVGTPGGLSDLSSIPNSIITFPYSRFSKKESDNLFHQLRQCPFFEENIQNIVSDKVETQLAAKIETQLAAKIETQLAAKIEIQVANEIGNIVKKVVSPDLPTFFNIGSIVLVAFDLEKGQAYFEGVIKEIIVPQTQKKHNSYLVRFVDGEEKLLEVHELVLFKKKSRPAIAIR